MRLFTPSLIRVCRHGDDGFATPRLRCADELIEFSPKASARRILPKIEELKIATREEVDIDSLIPSPTASKLKLARLIPNGLAVATSQLGPGNRSRLRKIPQTVCVAQFSPPFFLYADLRSP